MKRHTSPNKCNNRLLHRESNTDLMETEELWTQFQLETHRLLCPSYKSNAGVVNILLVCKC